MDVYLFSVLLLISIILLILNFFKKQIIVGIFAGIFFILCGILLWNGISYVSGYNEYIAAPCENNCTEIRAGNEVTLAEVTTKNITYVYSIWEEDVTGDFSDNEIVGTSFVLLGLFLLIINMVTIFIEKNEIDIGNDNDSDNEDYSD